MCYMSTGNSLKNPEFTGLKIGIPEVPDFRTGHFPTLYLL